MQVMNFEFDISVDFDQYHDLEVSFFHFNRMNNNRYTKSLICAPRNFMCDLLMELCDRSYKYNKMPCKASTKWGMVIEVNKIEFETNSDKWMRFFTLVWI